jgi:hypothetical protein
VLPVRTLIEENIQSKISYQGSDKWHTFHCNVFEAWVFFLVTENVPKIVFTAVLPYSFSWEVQKMPPTDRQDLDTAILREFVDLRIKSLEIG